MFWTQIDQRSYFCCSPQTPVRNVMASLESRQGPVLIVSDGRIKGIVGDCRALVEEHSYATSPFPIGQLLHNAARAFLLSQEGMPRLDAGEPKLGHPWIQLRASSQRIIAWVQSEGPLGEWLESRLDETGTR